MLKKIIIVVLLTFPIFQAHALPWDSPEKKARALVKKLEEFATELDGVNVEWNPTYMGLAMEITESGPVIVPILIEEVLDTTNAWNYRYLCEDRLIFVKGIDRENANNIIDTYIKIVRDKDEVTTLRSNAADALHLIGVRTEELGAVRRPEAHWVSLVTSEKRKEIVENLISVACDEGEGITQNSARWYSIRALSTYSDYAKIIIDSLSLNLNCPYHHIRAVAVNTIGGIGMSAERERIGEILVGELQKGERGLASGQVLFWLKGLEIREAIPLLLESLKTERYCSKADAAEILGEMKVKEAVPDLIELFGTTGVVSRYKAAEALGNMGDPRGIKPLIEATEKGGAYYPVVKALAQLNAKEAIEPLRECLKRSKRFEWDVAEALIILGDREAIPLIQERLDKETKKMTRDQLKAESIRKLIENFDRFKVGEEIKFEDIWEGH